MKQLTQKLKSGEMQVLDAPVPSLGKGQVLVRNYYSLISAGTEGSTVKAARKGYIGKAKERPQQVRQVIDTLKIQGPVQTDKQPKRWQGVKIENIICILLIKVVGF
jgi:hypothetical protein